MEEKKIIISVLIAVKNESRFIGETLTTLSKQDYPKDLLEIIIIDGNSSDNTIEEARKYEHEFENFKIIENKSELSAAGWNLGIKEAKGEVISILSGHVLLEKSYYYKVVKNLTANICGIGGKAIPIGFNKISKLVAAAYKSRFGSGGATYISGKKAEKAETISFGSYWKKDLMVVGGFDETVVRGQDWDLNLRLRKNGFILMFYPDIETRYYVRDSFSSLWKRQFLAGFWKWFINRKSAKHILFRHLIPGVFALLLILLTILSFASIISLYILIAMMIVYIIIVFAASITSGIKFSDMLYMLKIFFIIHFAYGLGIILGLWKK